MRTTSALTRNCAYVTKLSKARPRSAYVQGTAEEGTRFGKLVQDWIEGRDPQPPAVLDDPWCWFETLRQTWIPLDGVKCEIAMGLSPDGQYVAVTEPEPHVYVPVDPEAKLATAGRSDLQWWLHNPSDDDGCVFVADLKRSGWRYGAPEQVPQLMALGCAAARKYGVSEMRLGIYSAKDGTWEWSGRLRVDDVIGEVLEMAALPEDVPLPGPWCGGCYERKGCSAAETP